MDAIGEWLGEVDPGAEAIPTVLPAFTDSRWWRHAFPECVAYGFFPQRHQSLYDTWPLIHGADERIDIRDLGFAAEFYAHLPKAARHDRRTQDKLRLGGMALANGLLVHGPTHWSAAVRAKDGTIKVASGRKPRLRAADKVPGVRGVARLGEAMVVIPLVKRGLPEARLPFQHGSVAAVTVGATLGGALVKRRNKGGAGEVGAAVLSIAPAIFTLRAGEVAQYHGVEHKAIAAYEQDKDAPPRPTRSTSAAARTSSRR